MATTFPNCFHYFSKLPPELRRRVWELAIPERRVVEADMAPPADAIPTYCSTYHTTQLANAAPTLTSACREARQVALEQGGQYLLADEDLARVPNFNAGNEILNPWLWPRRDTVHINWEPTYAGDYQLDMNPIPWFSRRAERAGVRGFSVMASNIYPFQPVNILSKDEKGRPRIGTGQREFFQFADSFSRREYAVCLLTVIIHVTDNTFDRWTVPIQLVDAFDAGKIRIMEEVWCDGLAKQQEGDLQRTCKRLRDGRDTRPPEFLFKEIMADDFNERVKTWVDELTETWLWYKYTVLAMDNELERIVMPHHVWFPPVDPQKIQPFKIDMRRHGFNPNHPWVKATVDAMPRYRPVIMFRLCPQKCYLNIEHSK